MGFFAIQPLGIVIEDPVALLFYVGTRRFSGDVLAYALGCALDGLDICIQSLRKLNRAIRALSLLA